MPKPRNIAHVMHHLECIDPSLKPKFERLANETRYQAPELVGYTWKEMAAILQNHLATEAEHKAMLAVFNASARTHVEHTKALFRSGGPLGTNELASWLVVQCQGITEENCRKAAEYCIGVGVCERWLTVHEVSADNAAKVPVAVAWDYCCPPEND